MYYRCGTDYIHSVNLRAQEYKSAASLRIYLHSKTMSCDCIICVKFILTSSVYKFEISMMSPSVCSPTRQVAASTIRSTIRCATSYTSGRIHRLAAIYIKISSDALRPPTSMNLLLLICRAYTSLLSPSDNFRVLGGKCRRMCQRGCFIVRIKFTGNCLCNLLLSIILYTISIH